MVVSNDVVCDVISRVLRREKGRIARKNVEQIVRDILADIGIDISGKTANRAGYITGINRSLMLLVQEADGAKVVTLKPGMIVEIATDDYTKPYIQAKVVAAPPDSPYIQALEGSDIDLATTPVIGSYARTVVQIGVTDPPREQLESESSATAQLQTTDKAKK